MPIPATGGAAFSPHSRKVIRMILHGCTNRQFYHLVLMEKKKAKMEQCIEQLGSWDPMENTYGEKLLALNTERITYWIGKKVEITEGCMKLFGLAGILPIHPKTYMESWSYRAKARELREAQMRKEAENAKEET